MFTALSRVALKNTTRCGVGDADDQYLSAVSRQRSAKRIVVFQNTRSAGEILGQFRGQGSETGRGRGSSGELGSFRKGYKWFHFVRVGPRKWLRLVILPAGCRRGGIGQFQGLFPPLF